jgi:hypothetical protein
LVEGLPGNTTGSALLIQASATIPSSPFGQGLRCCGGLLKRMTPIHTPSGGATFWPQFSGDFFGYGTISERSNHTPGAPVHILPGRGYCYFVQYRQTLINPPCTFPLNFNASNAQTIYWHL